jgi:hypothetical protein
VKHGWSPVEREGRNQKLCALQAVTADLALVTILLLWVRQPRIARYTCAAQPAAVVIAWGVAMDRHFILPDVSVVSAVSYLPALPTFALVYAAGAAVLFPAFLYLLEVFRPAPTRSGGSNEPRSHRFTKPRPEPFAWRVAWNLLGPEGERASGEGFDRMRVRPLVAGV